MASKTSPGAVAGDAALLCQQIAQEIADVALGVVLPRIPSTTLRDALHIERLNEETVILRIAYYWARWYHDGRGPVVASHAAPGRTHSHVLIWFQNPRDDPRIGGKSRNYPVTANDVKSLRQFPGAYKRGLAENNRRKKNGQEPFMIITQVSGPFAGVPFFRALDNLDKLADEIARKRLDRFVRDRLPSETKEIVIRF